MSKRKRVSLSPDIDDLFHVLHDVPADDSPHLRANQVQMAEKIEEEIEMLQLKPAEAGQAFGGRTKHVRSQGKQVQVTVEQGTADNSSQKTVNGDWRRTTGENVGLQKSRESQMGGNNAKALETFTDGGQKKNSQAILMGNMESMNTGNISSKFSSVKEAYAQGGECSHVIEVKGTTNVAYIHGKTVFLAVDSRGTNVTYEGFVEKEDAKKFVQIKYNILASMAGPSLLCEEMLAYVTKNIDEAVLEHDVHAAAIHAFNFMKSWKAKSINKNRAFPASSLIAGFAKDKTPHVYYVGCKLQDPKAGSADRCLCATGTGGEAARRYIRELKGNANTEEEVVKMLKEALLTAAFKDPNTGGLMHILEVRPYNSDQHMYCKELLDVLLESFEVFSSTLSCKLFTLWFFTYHPYDPLFNQKLTVEFKGTNFECDQVIARKRTCVIRVIHSKDEGKAENLYTKFVSVYHEKSKANYDLQHLKLDIPDEVRDLPWIVVHGKPVLFTKPTREMLKLLREV